MSKRTLSPFWLLFILTGLNLFNYLDRYVAYQVIEPIIRDFGLTDGEAGGINTAFMIGYFLTAPFFGYLGDRMPRKWLIAAGIFVWSIGTVMSGFATGFISLLGYRVLVGLGEASYATISPSLISDTFGPVKRNNALTIFYVAIPVEQLWDIWSAPRSARPGAGGMPLSWPVYLASAWRSACCRSKSRNVARPIIAKPKRL